MLKYYQNMIKYIQRENLIDIRRQYMDVGVKSQSKQKKSKIQGFMDKIEITASSVNVYIHFYICIISISSIR